MTPPRVNRNGNRQGLPRGRQISRAARARQRRVLRLYEQGLSVAEICKRTGLGRTSVGRHLKASGAKPRVDRVAHVWTGRAPYWGLHAWGGAVDVVLGRKFCPGCGRWRHVVDFAPHPSHPDRPWPRCETCVRLTARHYWANLSPETRADRREANRFREEGRRRRRGARPRDFKSRPSVIDKREAVYFPVEPLRDELAAWEAQFEGVEHDAVAGPPWGTLAALAGVPDRSLYRVRLQSRKVQIDVADKLAVALGVPLALLYPEDR
jgi:DNA-binding CsgD family transcriptional regulator